MFLLHSMFLMLGSAFKLNILISHTITSIDIYNLLENFQLIKIQI